MILVCFYQNFQLMCYIYYYYYYFGEFDKSNLKFEKINKRHMLVLFFATFVRVGKLSVWGGFFQVQAQT